VKRPTRFLQVVAMAWTLLSTEALFAAQQVTIPEGTVIEHGAEFRKLAVGRHVQGERLENGLDRRQGGRSGEEHYRRSRDHGTAG